MLAEDAPHFLRGIGALTPACLIAAIGIEAALSFLSRRGLLANPLRAVFPVGLPSVAAAAILLLGANATRLDYFGAYVTNPMTGYWLEANNTALAEQVRADLDAGRDVRLDARLANDNPALRFLAPELARARVVGESAPGAAAGERASLIVDPNHGLGAWTSALPLSRIRVVAGPLAQNDLDSAPRRSFVAFLSDAPGPANAASAVAFDNGVELLAVDARGGDGPEAAVTVTMTWRLAAPIAIDEAVFVHWVRAGGVIAQSDASPGLGYFPMPAWRPGDTVVDARVLRAPRGWEAGDELRLGVYRRSDLRRAAIVGGPEAGATYVKLLVAR
jgi:hypothetical protein